MDFYLRMMTYLTEACIFAALCASAMQFLRNVPIEATCRK